MVQAAEQTGARTAVLTFFPHPKRVITHQTEPYYICTLDDRVHWLAELGVDIVITHPFNETVRTTRAAEFIQQLCQYLDMRQLWGGHFALGYQREGTVPFLQQLGQEKGYTVQLVNSMVMWDGQLVSSSRIRQHLQAGQMEQAHGCMARPYQLHGIVEQGDQRGRTIGFPTANLSIWAEQLMPSHGVYACRAWVNGQPHLAATNIGVRPTVNGHRLTVEAHLLDFSGDLYGQELCLELLHHIRAEQKFSGLDALKAQIQADTTAVRTLLSNNQ
jgi:riboflavin kinase/FMN adenylyltransferase